MYQPNRSSTRAGARTRTIICLDFGGRNIRVSTAVTDGTNKPVFKQIKTWPGKPGQSDFVPNLVIESKETDQQLWGYEAENALSDDPSKYQCHYDLKRYLMNVSGNGSGPDASVDKNSRENVCLTLISGLLNHAIGTPQPTSLLIIVAVPTHVKARGANRYLEIWSQASPIDSENTTVWVADEAEMGGRGTEMTAPLDTNDGHVLCTRVDVGSTTMDVTISVSGIFVFAQSLPVGFDAIDEEVRNSNLEPHDMSTLLSKLERRKYNVGKWQEALPDGPLGPGTPVPKLMLRLKEKENSLIKELVSALKKWIGPFLHKSSAKMRIDLWGGGVGSEPFNQHIREELEEERVTITASEAKYSHQPVLGGMEGLATDPGGVETAPIRCDIFLHNQPLRSKSTVMPLLLYNHERQELTSPVIYTLYAQGAGSKLTANFEIFMPTSAKGKTTTKTVKGAVVANSTKGLMSTGKCHIPLPITANEGSIYVFPAISGHTLVFAIVYRKDGHHIPDFEHATVRASDVFEDGPLFGGLKAKFRKNAEIGFVRTTRVALETVMSLENALLRLNKTDPQGPKIRDSILDGRNSSDGNNPNACETIEISDEENRVVSKIDTDMGEAGGTEHADQRKRSRSLGGHDGRHESPKRSRQTADTCAKGASSLAPTPAKDDQTETQLDTPNFEEGARQVRQQLQKFCKGGKLDVQKTGITNDLLDYVQESVSCFDPEILQATSLQKAIKNVLKCKDVPEDIKTKCRNLLDEWEARD